MIGFLNKGLPKLACGERLSKERGKESTADRREFGMMGKQGALCFFYMNT